MREKQQKLEIKEKRKAPEVRDKEERERKETEVRNLNNKCEVAELGAAAASILYQILEPRRFF
jgi:hypothetical protein